MELAGLEPEECTRQLQSIRKDDLRLQEVRVELPLPPGAIEAGVKEILDLESWQDALRQPCSDSPSGDTESNRASVDQEMRTQLNRGDGSGGRVEITVTVRRP